MVAQKVVPHMTDLVKVVTNEELLKDLLTKINNDSLTRNQAANYLQKHELLSLNSETAHRYIGSLCTFHFLNEENHLTLTKHSKDFLTAEITYPDFLLKCFSLNLEWSYFLPDIQSITKESKKKISKKQLLSNLEEKNYDVTNKSTVNRYLGEILPALDKAKVINYENAKISSGERTRKDILDYARYNRRELLRLLRLSERRVSKPKFRAIYRATVKAYLPLRQNRTLISKRQKEIDDIREMPIKRQFHKKSYNSFESKWELSDNLYDWQEEFLQFWLQKKRGIAEVVTGAGKTHLAMAIMETLKKQHDDLHVTIIVPTIVLLEQWYDNIVSKLKVSPELVGLKGGGYNDTFEDKQILIVVINSAIKNNFIKNQTEEVSHNLFIVDECHRAGAKEFQKVFRAHRDWELGLSATPEREMDNAYENVLVKELGNKIGSYTYNDALDDGIIPKFDIYNYAVILSHEEKLRYSRLTKEIHRIVDRLKYRYPQLNNPRTKMEPVLKKLQKTHPKDRDLFLYFQKTKERKDDVLYPAENRKKFVQVILNRLLKKNNESSDQLIDNSSPISSVSLNDRAIVFHEKIDEINDLFLDLDSPDVSIYHSGFPNSLNRIGLDLYQAGQTKVLLSVKALIEGVDVPKTNIGIIMASSSSQTQRIQSLGRVLRKAKGKNRTKLFISFVKNTTDERIYKYARKDWDKLIGKGNIDFRMWSEFGETEIEPPTPPQQKEYPDISTIDEKKLSVGSEYPGRYEGEQFSFDSKGLLFQKTSEGRNYIQMDVKELWNSFRKYKPTGGRLIINELGHTLIRYKSKRKTITLYLGNNKEILEKDVLN